MSVAPFEIDEQAFAGLSEPERKQELRKLDTLRKRLEANPLWRYVPHEGEKEWKQRRHLPLDGSEERGQQAYHEITQPVGAFVGGNRSGKTVGGVVDDVIQAVPEQFVPPWLLPYKKWGLDGDEFYCRVVVVDLVNALEGVLLPTLRQWLPKEALFKASWDKAYSDRRRRLQFANGSWFDFLTHDMDLDSFSGAALHRVHFDEEPPGQKGESIFNESMMRLIDFGGDCRFTMTPLFGLSWTYHLLTDEGSPRRDDEVHTVVVDLDHNPHVDETAKERTLARLGTEEERQARKSGRFVHLEGLIYPEFSKERHRVPVSELPEGAEVYESIDPGLRNPAYVAAYLTPQGEWTVFAEVPPSPRTVGQMAALIHGIRERWDFTPTWTTIDPAARNKSHQTGRSDQMEYAEHGIFTIPGQNSRSAGFNAVKQLLAPVDVQGNRLPPRLYVSEGCGALISEFQTYRWKPVRGEEQKDEPIKARDHLLDALRYLVMSKPVAPDEPTHPREETDAQRLAREHLETLTRGRGARVGGVIAA